MKKFFKKGFSLLLAVVMAASSVCISIESANADGAINAGYLSNHPVNNIYNEGIYATMPPNAAPYNTNWTLEYAPVTADAYYVIRNGERINIGMPGRGTLVKYSETEYALKINAWCTNWFTYTTEDIIVVDGLWKQNTGGDAVLKIEKTYLYYNGFAWTFSATEPKDSAAISGGVMQTDSRGFSNNGIYFALDANAAPYNTNWSMEYTQTSIDNIKIIRNGETISIGIAGRPLIVKFGETEYYLKLEGWNVGDYATNSQTKAITTDDIIIVEGDFKYAAENVTLHIQKSYVYYDGTAWVCSANEPAEPSDPTVISGGLMQSHPNSHAPYGIYFAMDANAAPYDGWNYEYIQTNVNNIKLIRGDVTTSIGLVGRPLIVKYGETDYYLKLEGWNVGEYGWNGQSNPITADDVIVIEGNFKYGNATLNITKSYVYYNGTAWVCSATEPTEPSEPPAPPVSEGISAGHLLAHDNGMNGTDGVYATMADNTAPYNGWSIEYAPATEDAYYVIRDGKRINIGMPGRGTLIKFSNTEYYLKLTQWCTNNFAFTTDDIIVVEGSWKQNTGGNAILKIDRTFLSYDGAVWNFSADFPFETVADTTGDLTTTVAANSSCALGQLSGISRGFTFDVNKPAAEGMLKIGLYNTAENDILKDGYILLMEKAGDANTLQFQLLGSGGTDLGKKAEVQVDGDTVTVHALCIDGTMYIVVADQIILTATGNDTMGTYINAVNEWSEDAVFTGIYTQAPKLPEFPTHITFEDIGVTLTENTLPMKSHAAVSFGEVSDLEKGFQLKVTVPETTTQGNVKIGFFNTQVANPWTNGYLVFVSPTEQEGTVKVSLNTADEQGERFLTAPVEVSGLKDYITISLWMEKGRVYLAAEGQVIAGWTDDGSIKLGLYMSAYSDWEQEGEYRSVNEIEIPPYVDTSVYVNFEDIAYTILKEVIPCSAAQAANFGEVTNTRTGFSMIMNTLSPNQTDMPVKLGFYNTGESNPWMDGYLVAVQNQEDGKYTFTLYKGRDQVLIKSISNVEISKNYLRFDAWITDGNTFHFKVNGEEILTHIDKKKEVAIGTYMAAYNDHKETIIFRTINPLVDTSKDVKFMDLGQSLGVNSVSVIPKMPVGLGRLNSSKNGFEFIISMPPASDAGKDVKIGIYNMEKKNPWTDGYIFIFSPRANGDMGISLRNGTRNGEVLLAFPDDLKGLTGDYLTVRAWISDVNGTKHIFHVSVNGTEVIRYKNSDGTVKLGTYLSIYQGGTTTLEFKTIHEILEPGELYLQRYGDPTAMRENDLPETEPDVDLTEPTEPTVDNPEQKDYMPVILCGAAVIVILAAVITVIVALKRNREKRKK